MILLDTGILLVGQTIAPQHCSFQNIDGQVTIEAIEDAVTFVNGRRITHPTLLRQGNRIVLGTSHIFRFNDPVEAARIRAEREEYLKTHPTEALSNPAVIDWNYAKEELRLMNDVNMGMKYTDCMETLSDEKMLGSSTLSWPEFMILDAFTALFLLSTNLLPRIRSV
jgi:kinesin family protein 1